VTAPTPLFCASLPYQGWVSTHNNEIEIYIIGISTSFPKEHKIRIGRLSEAVTHLSPIVILSHAVSRFHRKGHVWWLACSVGHRSVRYLALLLDIVWAHKRAQRTSLHTCNTPALALNQLAGHPPTGTRRDLPLYTFQSRHRGDARRRDPTHPIHSLPPGPHWDIPISRRISIPKDKTNEYIVWRFRFLFSFSQSIVGRWAARQAAAG